VQCAVIKVRAHLVIVVQCCYYQGTLRPACVIISLGGCAITTPTALVCCYCSTTCLPTCCLGWDRFCSDFDLVTDSLMGFYIVVDFQGLPIRKEYLVCFCLCCLAICHLINGCQGDNGHLVTAYQVPRCSSCRGFFFSALICLLLLWGVLWTVTCHTVG